MEIKAAQKSARMVQFYCRKYAGLCHFLAFLLQFLVGFLCPGHCSEYRTTTRWVCCEKFFSVCDVWRGASAGRVSCAVKWV